MSTSTDFRTLGRLGNAEGAAKSARRRAVAGRPERQAYRPSRQRPRRASSYVGGIPLLVLIGAAVGGIAIVLSLLGMVVGGQSDAMSTVAVAEPSLDPGLEATLRTGEEAAVADQIVALVPGASGGQDNVESVSRPFAAIDDLAIVLPVSSSGGLVFREAETPVALALAPIGQLGDNRNPEGFVAPEAFDGPTYTVGQPITGIRPATGMAAIMAAPATPVVAPADGVVEDVRETTAEGGATIWRVQIRSATRTNLFVVVSGLADPTVSAGDTVTAGVSALGAIGNDVMIDGGDNPLALPSVTLHVAPALHSAAN